MKNVVSRYCLCSPVHVHQPRLAKGKATGRQVDHSVAAVLCHDQGNDEFFIMEIMCGKLVTTDPQQVEATKASLVIEAETRARAVTSVAPRRRCPNHPIDLGQCEDQCVADHDHRNGEYCTRTYYKSRRQLWPEFGAMIESLLLRRTQLSGTSSPQVKL